jgi:hypothetical protein
VPATTNQHTGVYQRAHDRFLQLAVLRHTTPEQALQHEHNTPSLACQRTQSEGSLVVIACLRVGRTMQLCGAPCRFQMEQDPQRMLRAL